ncbi:MAG TPA: DUF2541 family protein [Bdellovibrionales bacterium]|nr:DUF2541 family protein [Bdellovibrionales bacterium]
MKKFFIGLSLALAAFSAQNVRAEVTADVNSIEATADYELMQRRWQRDMFLGQVTLTHVNNSRATLYTRTCQGRFGDRLSHLRFQVLNAEADIERLHVQFGNGQFQTINIRRSFRPGQSSGWINLRGGNDRCIRSITVDGDTDNSYFWTQAVIRFWGR